MADPAPTARAPTDYAPGGSRFVEPYLVANAVEGLAPGSTSSKSGSSDHFGRATSGTWPAVCALESTTVLVPLAGACSNPRVQDTIDRLHVLTRAALDQP
jgi:hypothetical protein